MTGEQIFSGISIWPRAGAVLIIRYFNLTEFSNSVVSRLLVTKKFSLFKRVFPLYLPMITNTFTDFCVCDPPTRDWVSHSKTKFGVEAEIKFCKTDYDNLKELLLWTSNYRNAWCSRQFTKTVIKHISS